MAALGQDTLASSRRQEYCSKIACGTAQLCQKVRCNVAAVNQPSVYWTKLEHLFMMEHFVLVMNTVFGMWGGGHTICTSWSRAMSRSV